MKNYISDLYDPDFVRGMFDRMSKTYGMANLITSFGFTSIWRQQCLQNLPDVKNPEIGYDLMSGMGEAWPAIQRKFELKGQIIAVDISVEMNRKATEQIKRLRNKNVVVRQTNILENDIPTESADYIISTFGLKTFNRKQQEILAGEVARILKPGGVFSFIEISKPELILLQWPYMFYLKIIIPLIGRVFLGNSEDYRMLGIYCTNFRDSSFFHSCLKNYQLKSNYKKYFFGCATGVIGMKQSLHMGK